MKVIFLDVDGVLNGYNKRLITTLKIIDKLKLRKVFRRCYDVFGVRTWKVFLLSLIVKLTGAKVVISSSWRMGWDVPYKEKRGRQKELHDKLNWFGIHPIGRTGYIDGKRELEIREWLSNHLEVESFIVLDDEQYDLQGFIGKELIRTSNRDYICGRDEEDTGLKIKHVIKAIKMLNSKIGET